MTKKQDIIDELEQLQAYVKELEDEVDRMTVEMLSTKTQIECSKAEEARRKPEVIFYTALAAIVLVGFGVGIGLCF